MKTSEMVALVDSLELTAESQKQDVLNIMASLGTGSVTRDEIGVLIPDDTRTPLPTVQGQPVQAGVIGATTNESGIRTIRSVRSTVNAARRNILWAQTRADQYRVEIHKKYSIALACLIFMMIGAPLGLAIRKGGLGTSAAMAVTIFLFHWVSLANGEKLADRGFLEPWVGMWIADIITGAIAIYLTFFVWKDLRAIPSLSLPRLWPLRARNDSSEGQLLTDNKKDPA